MPLNLTDSALDWSLEHAIFLGDTDIFPEAFEFEAIKNNWGEVKNEIKKIDILEWKIRSFRRCLVPKHRFGFRISTQMDPLDFLIFTSLVYEVGKKLESQRVPASKNIVHSYRFDPSTDGRMFSPNYNYNSFQQSSHDFCRKYKPTHVVVADIADFFPRLYTHRIDNALDLALGIGHNHANAIKRLINQWAGSYSYGIPVGSAAPRLIAELAISDVDRLLLAEKAKYVRFSDDFRIFCSSESEAYKYLTIVARALIDNHGLTLQQNKTRIVPIKEFKSLYLRENEDRELDTLSEKFRDLLLDIGVENFYDEVDYDSLSNEDKNKIDELNLKEILEESIDAEEPDLSLLKFLLRRLAQLDNTDVVDLIFENFNKFTPVIRETMEYLLHLRSLEGFRKGELGKLLIKNIQDKSLTCSHLEYSRMYMLQPFTIDQEWNCEDQYYELYNVAEDDFAKRKLILAMGRSGADYWFRSKKQDLQNLPLWVRRAFIYGASCLPPDEYKHWVRGIDKHLDIIEKSIVKWARKTPINH